MDINRLSTELGALISTCSISPSFKNTQTNCTQASSCLWKFDIIVSGYSIVETTVLSSIPKLTQIIPCMDFPAPFPSFLTASWIMKQLPRSKLKIELADIPTIHSRGFNFSIKIRSMLVVVHLRERGRKHPLLPKKLAKSRVKWLMGLWLDWLNKFVVPLQFLFLS